MENKKVVLAYSGGLDTSVIAHWLIQKGYQVTLFTANLGQDDDFNLIKQKANKLGIKDIFIEDLQNEFTKDFVFPMLRSGAQYEGEYFLGTAIARPLISKRLIEIAKDVNAEYIAHGATDKGNDQIRIELCAYALNPNIKIIAPWRVWDIRSRTDLINYIEKYNLDLQTSQEKIKKRKEYSIDSNLLHISYEGGILEDPEHEPDPKMWEWTQDPIKSKLQPSYHTINFEKGTPVAIDGNKYPPEELLLKLNYLAGSYGIGRHNIIESRITGMKSHGCYENPGGLSIFKAHQALNKICLDKDIIQLLLTIGPMYADLIYQGKWWSEIRYTLQNLIDQCQRWVTGEVTLRFNNGYLDVVKRKSPNSLYNLDLASFEKGIDKIERNAAEGYIEYSAISTIVSSKLGRIKSLINDKK